MKPAFRFFFCDKPQAITTESRLAVAVRQRRRRLCALLLGMWEFRRSVTSRCHDGDAYDWGREIAHRITARRFEDS
jgi:hypothetical protein